MFIGHFAIGFAAKKLNAKPSLGTYFLAAQFLDLLWPSLLLFNIERVEINPAASAPVPLLFTHYPVSHSLLAVVGWAVLLGGLYLVFRRDRQAALVVGLCVVSHWVLDLLVHMPDLPLYPGATQHYGLGLWRFKLAEMLLEVALFAGGVLLYFSATKAKNKTGLYAILALVAFLLVIHVLNAFGPPPPDVHAIAWAGQLQWLFVLWAFWADRNRVATVAPASTSSGKLRTFVQRRPLEKP